MADYKISKTTGTCSASGRALQEGEAFHTVILDGRDGLERRDYSEELWQGPPEGTLCHFKTRIPKKDEPKNVLVDDDLLVSFFLRLAEAKDDHKLRFRFVLSLILMRKRLLKYENTVREGDREYWEMKLMRDKSLHRVLDPQLDESQIEELSRTLNAILRGGADGAEPDPDRAAEIVDARSQSEDAAG